MSTYTMIRKVLAELPCLEILEMCGLSDDPRKLVEALADHIEENLEDIEATLIENGVMEDTDEW